MVAALFYEVPLLSSVYHIFELNHMAEEQHIGYILRQLERWSGSPLGNDFFTAEVRQLQKLLPGLFGYYLVQLGGFPEHGLSDASKVGRRVCIFPERRLDVAMPLVQGSFDELPLASDSVDVVLLPHVLEFAKTPHQVLREVYRVLIPEGHLILTGFNPWSIWGLRWLLQHQSLSPPWCGRFRSARQLRDWLSLLDFDIKQQVGVYPHLPFTRWRLAKRFPRMSKFIKKIWPFGYGGYVLVARKRLSTLTPLRGSWRQPRVRVTGTLVEPSSPRSMHYDKTR